MMDDHYSHLSRQAQDMKQKAEVELYKAALGGNDTAKRKLEGRETVAKAGAAFDALAEKAKAGDTVAIAQMKNIAAGASSPGAVVAKASGGSTPSPALIAAAEERGVQRERKRWATVFAHEASKGRERSCANVLAMPQGYAASAIIEEAMASETRKATTRAATDARWERARNGRAAAADPDKGKPVAESDPWARAYAKAGA